MSKLFGDIRRSYVIILSLEIIHPNFADFDWDIKIGDPYIHRALHVGNGILYRSTSFLTKQNIPPPTSCCVTKMRIQETQRSDNAIDVIKAATLRPTVQGLC